MFRSAHSHGGWLGVPLASVAAQAGARSCCGRRTSRAVAPDGSVLIAGATTAPAQGDVDWAVHRILPKADGSLETRRLATVEPMPAHIYGLSLGSGILTTADDSTLFQPFTNFGAYRGTWLNATGEPRAVRTTVDGLVSGRDTDCSSGSTAERCVTMWASGDGFHGRGNGTESGLTMLFENGRANWGPRVTRTGPKGLPRSARPP
ncbi:hypothetical protein [Streptomyces sp. NPDC049887]|uniref:hypothetical protein n=1 Tax=unclassified Streptomyces TaxID=2593676 RepID=UPI0034220763